ncbi:MAG: M20/M25/M40 family metallo-hydrolase, partial [Ramlibacter sp.]
IRGCTRTLSPAVRDLLEANMRRAADGICAAHGARADFWFKRNYPATVNTPAETAHAVSAAIAVAGSSRVNAEMRPWMTSEDFGFMLEQRPGAYMIIGNGSDSRMLHNARYDFNDAAIGFGVEYWIRLVENQMPIQPSKET